MLVTHYKDTVCSACTHGKVLRSARGVQVLYSICQCYPVHVTSDFGLSLTSHTRTSNTSSCSHFAVMTQREW